MKRYANLATEWIVETKAVVEKGKPKAAEKTLTRYQDQPTKSLTKVEELGPKTEVFLNSPKSSFRLLPRT